MIWSKVAESINRYQIIGHYPIPISKVKQTIKEIVLSKLYHKTSSFSEWLLFTSRQQAIHVLHLMDPSSVITQVTPDNNDASHLFTVQKGNGVQQKGKLHNVQNHRNQSGIFILAWLTISLSHLLLFRNEKKVQFPMLHYMLPRKEKLEI